MGRVEALSPLIAVPQDERTWCVILLWVFAGGCLYSLMNGGHVRFLPFMVSPFLSSSKLLIVTGLGRPCYASANESKYGAPLWIDLEL